MENKVAFFQTQDADGLSSEIRNFLSGKTNIEVVALSHCNIANTGPIGGFNRWNAILIYRTKP